MNLLENNTPNSMQAIGYAALITADGKDKAVWKRASADVQSLVNYLNGIALLKNVGLQAGFYEKVKTLTGQVPKQLVKKYANNGQKDTTSAFYPVYSTAYKVLFNMPGHGRDKMEMLASLIQPNGPYLNLAIEVLSAKKDGELTQAYISPVVKNIIAASEAIEQNQRNSPAYTQLIAQGKRLAALLPAAEGQPFLSRLESKEIIEIKLAAVPSKMAFDKEMITVPAGRQITLLFDNPDVMPHNVVIIQSGSNEKVGKAADAMASLKDGFEKHFVPDLPEVLFATPLVNAGKSFQLAFKAPETAGDYPFICSFPGHWRVMKGILRVSKPTLSKSE